MNTRLLGDKLSAGARTSAGTTKAAAGTNGFRISRSELSWRPPLMRAFAQRMVRNAHAHALARQRSPYHGLAAHVRVPDC